MVAPPEISTQSDATGRTLAMGARKDMRCRSVQDYAEGSVGVVAQRRACKDGLGKAWQISGGTRTDRDQWENDVH